MVNAAFLFLRRIRHCAGFGIQSPTDYAFVREVIYQRTPYYVYEELDSQFPSASKKERWQARLLHRVANHAQADKLVYFAESIPEMDAIALQKGCTKTHLVRCGSISDFSDYANSDGVWLVVPGIYGENKEAWEHLQTLDNIVAFDLYHLAIAFVDKKRYAEVHIVNPY